MHLVIVVDPITSKIITSTALADRLRAEGHRVTIKVPPGQLDEDSLAKLGLEVNLVDLRIDPPTRDAPPVHEVTRFQQQLAAEDADLHLLDTEVHEYILAALAAELPVALLSVFFNLWKRPGVPPVHQDVVPGDGWRGSRLGVEYGWFGYRAFRVRDIVRSRLRRDDRRHHLLAFARHLGLDPTELVTEFHGLIPFQYRTLPTITLNLPELELPDAVHPLNHYVGPMPNHSTVGMGAETEQMVLDEIDAVCAANPGRRLIYAAFGAYYGGDDLDFWRQAVAAVGARSDCIGVFGLGGRIRPEDLGPLPENVRVYPWAPQMRILERAACGVIHAGMTSVYECLHHEVPMVVFPMLDSFDQAGTAARVGYHRLGLIGDRASATAEEIGALIDEVLDDSDLEARLRSFRAAMDRDRDDGVLSGAVEAVAKELGVTIDGH